MDLAPASHRYVVKLTGSNPVFFLSGFNYRLDRGLIDVGFSTDRDRAIHVLSEHRAKDAVAQLQFIGITSTYLQVSQLEEQ